MKILIEIVVIFCLIRMVHLPYILHGIVICLSNMSIQRMQRKQGD